MKEIRVSDTCAQAIEDLRKYGQVNYNGDCEKILDSLSGLNNIICAGRDSEEVAFYANDAQRAMDVIMDYYNLLKLLSYENDMMTDGKVVVTQVNWPENDK